MIDFIKALITGINISELQQHPKLNFCIPINPITGEMRTKTSNKDAQKYYNAYYRGLEFRIYESGSVYVLGSLHKYWNHGGHNYNDFNLMAVYEVLQDIQDTFNIKPHQLLLRSLEIGVNFIPPYQTVKLLDHCFLHGTTPFVLKYYGDEGNYIQAEHSQYIIKIYDKARHYRGKGFDIPHPEIMRFEIKYKKLEKLKKHGIYTIQDLLDYGIEKFIPVLVEEWQKVLFYDFNIQSDSKALLNYKNSLYWRELTERRSAYYKHKRKLNEFILNHSDNIPLQIQNCISDKGILLTKEGTHIDQKNVTNYTPKKEQSRNIKSNESNTIKKDEGTHIDSLYIRSNHIPSSNNQKLCLITGVNISMQKEESFLISHTGFNYYLRTDKKIYYELIRKYCPKEFKVSDFKTQIEKTAHAIRCKKSNLENKQANLYPSNQYRLFF